jgi:predicted RecB family nuclease
MSSYPIRKIGGLDPEEIKTLKSIGIRTTERLLEQAKTPKGRSALAEKTGFDRLRILSWANAADRMRIKGMGQGYSCLLQAVGVDTIRELGYRNPANLAKAMSEANKKRKLVRFLPSEKLIMRWVEQAKALPRKISYR